MGVVMRSLLVLLIAVSLLAVAEARPAIAAAQARAAALIEAPLAVEARAGLGFGQVIVGREVVRLRTPAGAADCGAARDASRAPALFQLSGAANAAVSIVLPRAVDLVAGDGAGQVTVDHFEHSAGATPHLGADGGLCLAVGATLTVPAHQPPGDYSATFSVEIVYQ